MKGENATLNYPNEQIKKYALVDYFKIKRNFDIVSDEFKAILKDVHQGEFQKYMEYDNSQCIKLSFKIRNDRLDEVSWHANLSELLKLADIEHFNHSEINQHKGNIIMIIKDVVYIIEVKLSESQNNDFKAIATKTIKQIKDKKYDQIPSIQTYLSERKKIIHVVAIALYQVPTKNKKVGVMIGWRWLRYYDPTTSTIIKDIEFEILSSDK